MEHRGLCMGEKTDASFGNRTMQIYEILKKGYPNVKLTINFTNPLEILVATILSAQCTDAKVNEVTKSLFRKYRTPRDYANADLKTLEKEIRPTGFYHNKANYIQKASRMIVEDFEGKIPDNMEDLLKLPGVARKTANIVLSNAYGIIDGIAVDTHVRRVSQRLGLTENKDPNKIEKDLMKILPKTVWFPINYLLIQLGRSTCVAGIPYCEKCLLNKICPSAFTSKKRKSEN
jgi:endonuclease-3